MNVTNESTTISSEDQLAGSWIAFTIVALVVGATNFFVVFVVLRYKALRRAKEYLVILSLSLADGCNMLASFISGIKLMYLVFMGEQNELTTKWKCALVSYNLIWSFTDIMTGLVLLVISVDRLLSVTFPLLYLNWSTTYVKALFGSAYLYSLVTGTIGTLVFVYRATDRDEKIWPPICFGSANLFGQKNYYAHYRSYGGVTFALLSIVGYGLIWVLYKKHQNRVLPNELSNNIQKKQRLARQRRLTQSHGISCLCTIFIYVIPYCIGVFAIGIFSNEIRLWFFVLAQLNPLCNFIIYYYRQPEMKEAFVALFTGKTMPPTLSAWKANKLAKTIKVKKAKQVNEGPPQGQQENNE